MNFCDSIIFVHVYINLFISLHRVVKKNFKSSQNNITLMTIYNFSWKKSLCFAWKYSKL